MRRSRLEAGASVGRANGERDGRGARCGWVRTGRELASSSLSAGQPCGVSASGSSGVIVCVGAGGVDCAYTQSQSAPIDGSSVNLYATTVHTVTVSVLTVATCN